jgi:hypothetical protein
VEKRAAPAPLTYGGSLATNFHVSAIFLFDSASFSTLPQLVVVPIGTDRRGSTQQQRDSACAGDGCLLRGHRRNQARVIAETARFIKVSAR